MLRIKSLLGKSIDNSDNDPNIVPHPRMLALKYASASDVASILQSVYRDQTGSSGRAGGAGGLRGFTFPGLANTSADSGVARPTALQIGIDDRSNSLVLNCSEN